MNFRAQSYSAKAAQQLDATDFNAELIIASPGRINLIGEHTDYNDGFVLPTAINKKIYFYFRKNNSQHRCMIYSKSYNKSFSIDLQDVKKSDIEWENYILGVVYELLSKTDAICGFDCIIDSELPMGAGISSSAALECGMAYGLNTLFKLNLPVETLIKLSRDAEHNFVGTQCGIMDQFAVMMSKKNHVIQLDCQTLAYRHIPLTMGSYSILLLNTNVSHNLASSAYNKRREECELGVRQISNTYPRITSLREVTQNMLDTSKKEMHNTIYKRCQFIVDENQRVLDAAKALKKGHLETLGELMYSSHEGLQHSYDVSCPELDFLVAFSRDKDAVLGSRMMGGGFGGCTINIIHKNAIAEYVKEIATAYRNKFNIDVTPIEVSPGEGTLAQYIQ